MNKKKELNKKQKLFTIIAAVAVIIAVLIIVIVNFKKNDNNTGGNEPINENFSFLVDEPSTLLVNNDFFEEQVEVNNNLLNEYKKGDYTVDNPYIIINPYSISPQTALVLFKTDKSEKVTITLKGKHNDDWVTEFEASTDHYIPIYGLYGEYNNEIIITTESGKTKTIYINIESSTIYGDIEVITNNAGNMNGELYFGTTALGAATLGIDNYGEVRWYLAADYSKGMTFLQNGHLLLSDITEGPNVTSTGGVIEVDMLGYIHRQYEIEGGYHHDAYEMSNGNLLITSTNIDSDYMCDTIYEIDRETGQVVKTFDLTAIVKAIDENAIEYGEIAWGFTNSVYLDEDRGELVLSLRNRNSVVALDYETGTIKWILGQSKYWTSAFSKYLIKGLGTDFIYPAGQHSVLIDEDGNLSIFNNGYNSYRETEVACSTLKNNESYAMIYSIDRENMTARVLYKWGGQKYFSYALSSFNYDKNGHKIINSGWHFSDESIYSDTSCTQFTNDKYNAYIVELDENDNVLVELLIDEAKFEVVKAPIYNLEALSINKEVKTTIANYEFNDDAYYSTDIESTEYEVLSESEALAYKNNTSNPMDFFVMNNIMTFEGILLTSSEFKVTLISPKGIAYRYTIKEAGSDEYGTINLNQLPEGRYYIYMNLDDSIYNTNQYVEVSK